MLLKLCLFLLPLSFFAQELVWSSSSGEVITKESYNKIIKEYVDKTYPQKVKAYNSALQINGQRQRKIELAREKEIRRYTVTLNGLMWQDDINSRRVLKNWQGAKDYCADLELLGFTNWRLADIDELKSIVDKSRKPSIRREFRNSILGYYWSSTPDASSSKYAWRVYFKRGHPSYGSRGVKFYVRCVRTEQ